MLTLEIILSVGPGAGPEPGLPSPELQLRWLF